MTRETFPLTTNMAAAALDQVERQLRRFALAQFWDQKDRARITDMAALTATLARKCRGSYLQRERDRNLVRGRRS